MGANELDRRLVENRDLDRLDVKLVVGRPLALLAMVVAAHAARVVVCA